MENWGLIGFRETSLLYSDTTSSPASKQNIALTVAHEVAHFWFGNLVTCKWWYGSSEILFNAFLKFKTLPFYKGMTFG